MSAFKKCLLTIIFINISTYSETERFDMALSGEFQKDYCEISFTNPSSSITIDYSNPTRTNNSWSKLLIFHYPNLASAIISCSAGDYLIYSDTTNDGEIQTDIDSINYNIGYMDTRHFVNDTLYREGHIRRTMRNDYRNDTPIATAVEFEPIVRFEYDLEISVYDSFFRNKIPESVFINQPFTYTIDKVR